VFQPAVLQADQLVNRLQPLMVQVGRLQLHIIVHIQQHITRLETQRILTKPYGKLTRVTTQHGRLVGVHRNV
jgi:hypothetical protein